MTDSRHLPVQQMRKNAQMPVRFFSDFADDMPSMILKWFRLYRPDRQC
jgi:hypothetical protein